MKKFTSTIRSKRPFAMCAIGITSLLLLTMLALPSYATNCPAKPLCPVGEVPSCTAKGDCTVYNKFNGQETNVWIYSCTAWGPCVTSPEDE